MDAAQARDGADGTRAWIYLPIADSPLPGMLDAHAWRIGAPHRCKTWHGRQHFTMGMHMPAREGGGRECICALPPDFKDSSTPPTGSSANRVATSDAKAEQDKIRTRCAVNGGELPDSSKFLQLQIPIYSWVLNSVTGRSIGGSFSPVCGRRSLRLLHSLGPGRGR